MSQSIVKVEHLSHRYSVQWAVRDINLEISQTGIVGLLGSNGAGKSTLMRMMTGVLKADEGYILVDGRPVYDNADVKKDLFFISDEPYFFANSTASDMQKYLNTVYPDFDNKQFEQMLDNFGLPKKCKV